MIRLSYALAGVLLCATPALADQFVTPLGGPSQGVVVERRSGTTGSVNVPVDENNPLPVTVTSGGVAQGSATSGQSGDLMQGAVTTSAPTYTTGQTNPLSLTARGGVRVTLYDLFGNPQTTSFNVPGGAATAGTPVSGVYLSSPPALANSQSIGLTMTAQGALRGTQSGGLSSLNITSSTTVKGTPGRIAQVCLNTAGSTASSIIDSTSTTATAANTILTIPSAITAGTCFKLDWVTATGIGIVPGTGAVMAISYE